MDTAGRNSSTVPSDTIVCPACARRFSARMGACPFCGQKKDAPVLPTATETQVAMTPGFVAPVRPATLQPQAPGATGPTPGCIVCGAETDLVTLRIETWEDLGTSFTGKQKFRVRSLHAPCYCKACNRGLRRRRFLADFLTALPIALLVPAALPGKNGGFPAIVAMFLYTGYLLRWGSYTWFDKMVYGAELESTAAEWIPEGTGKIKFPVNWLRGLMRVFLLVFLAFVSLAVCSIAGCGRT